MFVAGEVQEEGYAGIISPIDKRYLMLAELARDPKRGSKHPDFLGRAVVPYVRGPQPSHWLSLALESSKSKIKKDAEKSLANKIEKVNKKNIA